MEIQGGCHCKAVRFRIKCGAEVDVYECNCSICNMKNNEHFVVSEADFELLSGEDQLSLYQFGTMQARHLFCKICGVQSFYGPRSSPGCYGITVHCLDDNELKVNRKTFDGQNWEA